MICDGCGSFGLARSFGAAGYRHFPFAQEIDVELY